MGGLADQSGAAPGKGLRRQSRDGKLRPRADLVHLPKKAFEPVLQRSHEIFRIEPHDRFDLLGAVDPDHARRCRAGQRHGGDRAALAMELDRDAAMRRRDG